MKPPGRYNQHKLRYTGLVALFMSQVAIATEADLSEGVSALAELEYKREVLMYCGISEPAAVRGYLDRQEHLVKHYQLDKTSMLEAGSQARQLAYAEWQNRGLGGFRGWCRKEGSEYTEILKSYVLESG
ncbi:MAG: hypothetical protein ACR2QW_13595 [bacterium]